MLSASQVTAVIPTRGDHPETIERIIADLPYDEVIVWDNSTKPHDLKTYGRWLAAEEARNEFIYFQDDDLIFSNHDALLAEYFPGTATVNMPDSWWDSSSYPRWDVCQFGAGSIMRKGLWRKPFDRYLEVHPQDDLFLTYSDNVPGALLPFKRVDLGYDILPHALAPGRICTTPGNPEWRMTLMNRVFELRDQGGKS